MNPGDAWWTCGELQYHGELWNKGHRTGSCTDDRMGRSRRCRGRRRSLFSPFSNPPVRQKRAMPVWNKLIVSIIALKSSVVQMTIDNLPARVHKKLFLRRNHDYCNYKDTLIINSSKLRLFPTCFMADY